MKRRLTLKTMVLTAGTVALLAGAANAQGLNLSWDDCGSFGSLQKNFACASNAGLNTMVASMVLGTGMPELNGHEGVFDMQTNEAALSPWWTFTTPATTTPCTRVGSTVSADFNFLALSNCLDPWANAGFGGVNWVGQFEGRPNRGRIRTVYAINPSTSVDGVTELYVAKVSFTNSKSTGTNACAGCADGACFVFNQSKMTQPLAVNDNRIVTTIQTRRHVIWQAGGATIGGAGCPNEVPTRTQTWGAVKSLYR